MSHRPWVPRWALRNGVYVGLTEEEFYKEKLAQSMRELDRLQYSPEYQQMIMGEWHDESDDERPAQAS